MNQVALILVKDLRRLGWPLLLLWLLILGGAWLDLRDAWSFDGNRPLLDLKVALTVLAPLTSIVVVGLLIHQDPLLGTSAYWMTRPVRPLALLGAKAAFVFLFVVLFPALVDLGVLIYFGLEPSRWLEALLTGFAGQGLVLVVVAALAAVTASIPVFLITCIAATVGMLLIAAYTGLWMSGSSAMWGGALSVLAVLGVSCVVVWRQYRRCDARMSTALLAAGLLIGPFATWLPWYQLQPSTFGKQLSVTLSPAQPDGNYRVFGGSSLQSTTVRWGLFNAPPDQYYELDHLWGKVRLDDGRQIVASSFSSEPRSSIYRGVALKALLPGHFWYGPSLESRPDTTLSLHVDTDAASVVLRTVSFEGQAQLQAYAFVQAGALPVTPGTRLQHGSLNLELLDARTTLTDVVVNIRYSRIVSDRFRGDTPEFLLVRKDRLQVARQRSPTERDDPKLRRNSSRFLVKPGGIVKFWSLTCLYPLPLEAGSDRLEDLEIQVWEAVPTEPYFGVVDVPEFRTARQAQ